MKEQKISNDSPKKKVVEKNENTNRNAKSKSIDNRIILTIAKTTSKKNFKCNFNGFKATQ